MNGVLTGTRAEPRLARRASARRGPRKADRRRHGRHDARRPRAAGRARAAGPHVRGRGRARSAQREAPRDGVVPELQPEPRRDAVLEDREDHRQLSPRRAARQPRVAGPLPAGLDVQGRHGLGGPRVEPLRPRLRVRRSRLLHRVRQAGQQLRHGTPLRPSRPRDRAQVLGQLGVLQHRARRSARSGSSSRRRSSASTSARRSRRPTGSGTRAASTGTASSGIRSTTPTSTRAAWRSVRSACSSRRCRWRWSPAPSATPGS